MKLGAKIIVSIMIFFSVIFLFGGYVLISYFYEVTMEREVEGAIEQYQYNKFVVQANLITRIGLKVRRTGSMTLAAWLRT